MHRGVGPKSGFGGKNVQNQVKHTGKLDPKVDPAEKMSKISQIPPGETYRKNCRMIFSMVSIFSGCSFVSKVVIRLIVGI